MEFIPKNKRAWYGSLYNVIDLTIYAQMAIYFWAISKQWQYFYGLGWICNFAGLVMLIKVPESPLFLISKGKLKKTEEILRHIA